MPTSTNPEINECSASGTKFNNLGPFSKQLKQHNKNQSIKLLNLSKTIELNQEGKLTKKNKKILKKFFFFFYIHLQLHK